MSLACSALTLTWTRRGDVPLVVLDAVDAQFPDGAMTLVSGATGVGKSTLLHLLAGLLRPTSGTVSEGENPISRWTAPHRDQWRRAVGICFQELHLVAGLRVWENIVQPLIPHPLNWTQMMDAVGVVSARMDVDALLQAPVRTLSGGQRQRVAIARAMVHTPRILLLDEPTAFQDDAHTERFIKDLDAYASSGACVVVCSHDPRLREDVRYTARYHLSNGNLEVRP